MNRIESLMSEVGEKMAGYGEYSMVYRVIKQNLLILTHRLENVEKGWKKWCEQVPSDLEWHGLGREGIYELIVEDYLNGSKTFQLWLIANDAQVTVESKSDRLLIALQEGGEHYGILLRNMCGKINVTYTNSVTDAGEVHWEESYLTFICDPSFKDPNCDKD